MKAASASKYADSSPEPDGDGVEFYDPYRSIFEFRPAKPGRRLGFDDSRARRKDDLFKDRRFES